MPNYEFRCLDCKRRFEVYLSYEDYGVQSVRCTNCNSEDVQRLIGRIRFARSEESRLENLADPSNLAGLEDDPKGLARMMRQMSSEMDEDLGPEYDEVLDRLESGQSPEDIESDMPELGSEAGGMGAGGFPDL
jgi:putative FmdB family regulatory protein